MDKYEKLYNEALERFKSFKEKYYTKDTNLGDVIFDKNGEMQKDFNGIFPELRESEDERIRRKMIEHFKSKAKETWCNMPVKSIISYLEKQKEVDWEEELEKCKRNYLYFFDKYVKIKLKPAEWSEEDERIIAALTKALIGSDSAEKIMLFDGVTIEMVSDWLKSLRPVSKESLQSHWKPSEKQIKAIESCFCEFGEGCPDEDGLRSLYNDLKKLI